MALPKPTLQARQLFDAIVPRDPRVEVRPIFGNVAAFLNGHMFIGVFGSAVFVRLPEGDRTQALKVPQAKLFEPMKGRPMSEYVTVPPAFARDPSKARAWVESAVRYVGAMPAKSKGGPPKKAAPARGRR